MAETPINLFAAAKIVTEMRGGDVTSDRTIHQWIVKGLKNLVGERVKLGGRRIGGCWYTTRAELEQFIDAMSATPAAA
jgi:hypothetical protein